MFPTIKIPAAAKSDTISGMRDAAYYFGEARRFRLKSETSNDALLKPIFASLAFESETLARELLTDEQNCCVIPFRKH